MRAVRYGCPEKRVTPTESLQLLVTLSFGHAEEEKETLQILKTNFVDMGKYKNEVKEKSARLSRDFSLERFLWKCIVTRRLTCKGEP